MRWGESVLKGRRGTTFLLPLQHADAGWQCKQRIVTISCNGDNPLLFETDGKNFTYVAMPLSGEKDAPSPNQAWNEDGINLTALREEDADDESESESESELDSDSDSAIEPEPTPTHVSTEADVVLANEFLETSLAEFGLGIESHYALQDIIPILDTLRKYQECFGACPLCEPDPDEKLIEEDSIEEESIEEDSIAHSTKAEMPSVIQRQQPERPPAIQMKRATIRWT